MFNSPTYSLDCIASITNDTFLTGSQDNTISLWHTKKKKPLCSVSLCHEDNWITSLVTNILFFYLLFSP